MHGDSVSQPDGSTSMSFTAYWNGDWVPSDEIRIDPLDRGFMVADATFEATRTFNGKIYHLGDHIQRLYRSLDYIRLDPGLTQEEMADLTEEAVERNLDKLDAVGDLHIHHFVTRGKGRRAWSADGAQVGIRVSGLDFAGYYTAYEGLKAVITRTQSYHHEALDPKIKHYSRMNFNLAELEANEFDPEALPILRDRDGCITEGSSYNVFIVNDGVVRTSTTRTALAGVSRKVVLGLTSQLDIETRIEDIQPYDVLNADECFFTSTSWCMVPVTTVDKQPVGDGAIGPVTKQLLAAWSEKVGLDIVDQAVRYSTRHMP